MDAVDKAVIVSALEIASIILSGHDEGTLLWSKEHVLDHLDISDEEADILLDRIKEMLDE